MIRLHEDSCAHYLINLLKKKKIEESIVGRIQTLSGPQCGPRATGWTSLSLSPSILLHFPFHVLIVLGLSAFPTVNWLHILSYFFSAHQTASLFISEMEASLVYACLFRSIAASPAVAPALSLLIMFTWIRTEQICLH